MIEEQELDELVSGGAENLAEPKKTMQPTAAGARDDQAHSAQAQQKAQAGNQLEGAPSPMRVLAVRKA